MSDVFRKVYNPLSDDQKRAVEQIKDKAEELMALFGAQQGVVAEGRCMSLARTNLEQCVMWAIKAIT